MTDPATYALICPQCRSLDGVELSDGRRLCFDCRHEWSPAEVDVAEVILTDLLSMAELPRPARRPTAAEWNDRVRADAQAAGVTIDEPVVLADALDDVMETLTAQLVGRRVAWDEGAYEGVIVRLDDEGDAVVRDDTGAEWTVTPAHLTILDEIPPIVDMDDATVAALGAAQLTFAALTLKAGLQTLAPKGAERPIVAPPEGWFPTELDAWPVAEAGVAYAVAFLIVEFGIDRDDVSKLVASWTT